MQAGNFIALAGYSPLLKNPHNVFATATAKTANAMEKAACLRMMIIPKTVA
jgi:hypothetical protein